MRIWTPLLASILGLLRQNPDHDVAPMQLFPSNGVHGMENRVTPAPSLPGNLPFQPDTDGLEMVREDTMGKVYVPIERQIETEADAVKYASDLDQGLDALNEHFDAVPGGIKEGNLYEIPFSLSSKLPVVGMSWCPGFGFLCLPYRQGGCPVY